MRITMKGGVWKNSEDEILKAAVMKYGLNNWSRVASLLVRKSTKQCKSRWYEWLDPAVKKTEWTRDEEEKLLHLAKLFPNQWRTIAPIVGRTAHQCLDHYDRLLDQAQGRTEEDRLNDPRRLRPGLFGGRYGNLDAEGKHLLKHPSYRYVVGYEKSDKSGSFCPYSNCWLSFLLGEIDPHPETKPSRADAVDMDDDEKEMLAEARARLANTRGKKAKRKAREKQLEEARRLAALQKRRELKAAGINIGRWRRRNQAIDYAREIPFEQQPPKGFYSVEEDETPAVARGVANVNLQQLEGERRADEERRLRKEDTRKLKRVMDENLPEAIRAIEKINEPPSFRKRTKLSLPAPQLSDAELDDILNIGKDTGALPVEMTETHSNMLLTQNAGIRQPLPQLTPMRTPMVENTILLEAQNAVARTVASTPLEGGEAPVLHDVVSGMGATPSHMVPRTPHPLTLSHGLKKQDAVRDSTPFSTQGSLIPATPFSCRTGFAGTPMHDGQMSLSEMESQGSAAMEAMIKMQVRSSLANLPTPQNEIEMALPDAEATAGSQNEADNASSALEEDADDVEERKRREAEEERLRKWKCETQVIQQNLPRPLFVDLAIIEPANYAEILSAAGDGVDLLDEAESYVNGEMMALLKHDAVTHPLPIKGLRLPQDIPQLEDFGLSELEAAKEAIQEETSRVQQATGQNLNYFMCPELRQAWDDVMAREFLLDPASKVFMDETQLSHEARLEALKTRFEQMKAQLLKEVQKARKSETKLETLTKGYFLKSQKVAKSIEDLWSELLVLEADLSAFGQLEKRERTALQARTEELEQLVKNEKSYQQQLQLLYAGLANERDKLRRKIVTMNDNREENGAFSPNIVVR